MSVCVFVDHVTRAATAPGYFHRRGYVLRKQTAVLPAERFCLGIRFLIFERLNC